MGGDGYELLRVFTGTRLWKWCRRDAKGDIMIGRLKARSRAALVVAVALPFVVALAPSVPASATMFVINAPLEFHATDDFAACGLSLHDQFDVTGTQSIRTGTG